MLETKVFVGYMIILFIVLSLFAAILLVIYYVLKDIYEIIRETQLKIVEEIDRRKSLDQKNKHKKDVILD